MHWRFLVALILAGTTTHAAEVPLGRAAVPSLLQSALIGRVIEPAITESSGVVASRTQQGVLWTHNDSGNAPVVYAIDRTGALLGAFTIARENVDWEDIATDDTGRLYIADIGDNGCRRAQVAIHRIVEPRLGAETADPIPVETSWRLTFPDAPRNCEAFVVANGSGWLIEKVLGSQAHLWRFHLDGPTDQVLKEAASLPILSPVTGADISADGKTLAVIGCCGLNLFHLSGDVASAASATPLHLGFLKSNIEACCFVSGGVLATSEDRRIYLFTNAMFPARSAPKP